MTQKVMTNYEKNQSFNPIVRYLHSVRYIYLTELFDEFQKQNPNKTINVLELGCAHAKSFELLNSKYNISYVGIEIDENFAQTAKDRFKILAISGLLKDPQRITITNLKTKTLS
jgi:23S rRNA A1618 N6-methylase RlmF